MIKSKLFILSTVLISAFFFSCSPKIKETEESTEQAEPVITTDVASTKKTYDFSDFYKMQVSPLLIEETKLYANLDYTAEKPEPISEAKKVSYNNKEASSEKSESYIPPIRNLSKYLINYSKKEKVTNTSAEAADKNNTLFENDSSVAFKIKSCDFSLSDENHIVINILFSKSVVPLSSVGSKKADNIFSITPKINGNWRWVATDHLCFESSDLYESSTRYDIQAKESVKSIYGEELTGQANYNWTAPLLCILTYTPGYIENDSYLYKKIGFPPEACNNILLKFNNMISEAQAKEIVCLLYTTNSEPQTPRIINNFEIKPVFDKKFYSYIGKNIINEEKGLTNCFTIKINEEIPFNSTIKLGLLKEKNKPAEPNNITNIQSHSTLNQFKILEEPSINNYEYDFSIDFSTTSLPDSNSIADSISIDGVDKQSMKDKVYVYDNSVYIRDLPYLPSKKIILHIDNFKDVYGRTISLKKNVYELDIPSRKSGLFLDVNGTKLMEAQYPHKLILGSINLEWPTSYHVEAVTNPYAPIQESETNNITIPSDLNDNTYHYEEIDLNPYLTNGYGFVQVSAISKKDDTTPYGNDIEVCANILVTDIGITCRAGMNRAVVMVRSLSTGKPIADADVKILSINSKTDVKSLDGLDKEIIGQGKSDENGVCVINFAEEGTQTYEKLFLHYNSDQYYNNYSNRPVVSVTKGDDQAVFIPDSHSEGRYVNTDYQKYSRGMKKRTFIYMDRDLYRRGEEVNFRVIDRNQILGKLYIPDNFYYVRLQRVSYDDLEDIGPVISGALSKSGGASGKFTLPSDLPLGQYALIYSRDSDPIKWYESKDTILFNVLEFEGAKTQSSIETERTNFISGEKIDTKLNASYLAGGYLYGGKYSTDWYKEESIYKNEKYPDYKYGFAEKTISRNNFSSQEGTLSSVGSADISITSDKANDGRTYKYTVETEVQDASNERIDAKTSITVHPSSFYIGLEYKGTHFYSLNDEIKLPFILTDLNGDLLSNTSSVKSIEYTLSHDEWKLSQEKSVNSSVYTRYETVNVKDDSGKIKVSKQGVFSIKPKASGWNKITLKGTNSKGQVCISECEFYVSGSSNISFDPSSSKSIKLTPSAALYNPGDTAEVLVESPLPKGDYLVTLEREGIFTEDVYHFDSPTNIIKVKIAKEFLPVVYLTISSYSTRTKAPEQKYREVDINKPAGYFGATSLFVDKNIKAFSIDIKTDKEKYKPGEEMTVTLKATKNKKPLENAEISLMAVDRSIVDISDYHIKNPIDFFYSPSNYPLYTIGGDSRDYLMDPVIYSIKDLQGGDADAEKDDERNDFRPTAFFEPSLITNKDGTATYKVKLPDNLTTYRLTAFGVKEDLFALQEGEVLVQNVINVQKVQPLKLRERDTAECGVLITNLTNKSEPVEVSVLVREVEQNKASNLNKGLVTTKGKAVIDGEANHTVKIEPNSSSVVYFDVAAISEGEVELVYKISSKVFNETVAYPLNIEKTFTYQTSTINKVLDNKENKATEGVEIPSSVKENNGTLKFTLDSSRLGALSSSVNYVFDYPYGCLEQQSSKLLPLIIFGDYIDVFGLDSKVMNVESCVKDCVKDWGKYQLINGGFPYWPEGTDDAMFPTLKIAHVYALALKQGYSEKDFKINKAKLASYINKNIGKYNDYIPYACYVLSLLGSDLLDSTLDIVSSSVSMKFAQEGYYALAYLNKNNDESLKKAEVLKDKMKKQIKINGRGVQIEDDSTGCYFINSRIEKLALALQVLSSFKDSSDLTGRLVYTLLQEQSLGYWCNTSTTTCALEAIRTYIINMEIGSTDFVAKVNFNSKEVMNAEMKGLETKPKTLVLPFDNEVIASAPKDSLIPLEISKKGKGTLYYTVEMKYAVPDECITATNQGFQVVYDIYDFETGEKIKPTAENTIELQSGKKYQGVVSIYNNSKKYYAALRVPVPSGANVMNPILSSTSSDKVYCDYYSNKETLSNEMRFFYNSLTSQKTTASFLFTANRRGVYPTPPAQVECMYESETFGNSDGFIYIIK